MRGLALDCYGTLLRIGRPLGASARAARLLRHADAPSPMTTDIGIHEALMAAGCDPDAARGILRDMQAEADSVEALPGALDAIARATGAGMRVVVASNLSREYAPPIRRLLGDVPAVLSFAVGCRKPQLQFFGLVQHALGLPAADITMVGDSRSSDHAGATEAGMRAILLTDRTIEGVETAADIGQAVDRILSRTP